MISSPLEKLNTDSSVVALSRLGYPIPIFDENGDWLENINIVDDIGEIRVLESRKIETSDWQLNEAIKFYAKNLICDYMPATVVNYWRAVGHFCREYNRSYKGKELAEPELLVAIKNAIKSDAQESNKAAITNLLRFALLHEVPGFSYELIEKVKKKHFNKVNKDLNLLFLDPDLGPFVGNEMHLIRGLLDIENIPIESKVIIGICSEYGIRPIQLSLLRENDFFYDSDKDSYFLKVPRVKQDDRFRRKSFSKRLLDKEQTRLVWDLINYNKAQFPRQTFTNKRPLFFRKTSGTYEGAKIRHDFFRGRSEYSYHIGPRSLRGRFQNQLAPFLPISPRTQKSMHINIYRFRYTVALNAVREGNTEQEVADLLDHSNVRSIKHYLKMSTEVHALLDEVTEKRIEQMSFADAWLGEDKLPNNIYTTDILEEKTLSGLGKCSKKGHCGYEPGIACYACHRKKFHPNKDLAAHMAAKTIIEERIAELIETSTGAIPKQLLEAKIGNQAAIRYAQGMES